MSGKLVTFDQQIDIEPEMKVTVTDIKWDTDGEDVDLPAEMVIEVPEGMDEEEADEFVSDEISNQTGFCHTGYSSSTLKERLRFFYQEQEADYDPEETKNVLETLDRLGEDLKGAGKWDFVELMRMLESGVDPELYKEVEKLELDWEEKQNDDPFA